MMSERSLQASFKPQAFQQHEEFRLEQGNVKQKVTIFGGPRF
jgi:hypothetical protein